MQIKAQGLLNAAKWIEDDYGRDTLRDVLHACGPATRDRYTSVIAIDWHPADEFIDFVRAAEQILGAGRPAGRVAEAIGAAGARGNMKGTLVRFAMWIANPPSLVSRAAGLWRQFNDQGAMELQEIGVQMGRFELTGVDVQDALFCSVITGWFRQVALTIGAVTPVAKHVECRALGKPRCMWEVRYARTEPRAGGKTGPART